jgi:phosphonate transport system substrate-binding protein
MNSTTHITTAKRIAIFLTASILLFAVGSSIAETRTHYKLGVFPFMPMTALIKYFNAVGIDLTHQLNKRVIAQTRPSFKDFSSEIEKETYDIIFVQPFDYPLAADHNYIPIVRRGSSLDSLLVTKFNNKLESISDLAGKTLATPPAESAVSIIIKKELSKYHLLDDNQLTMIYTRNHFACIQMVLVGKADACSTTSAVLYHWQNIGIKKEKLRIFHRAQPLPHSLYMAHKRVPEKDREKLKQAMMSWDKRPEGKMILKQFSLQNFIEATDADYDVIRNFQK